MIIFTRDRGLAFYSTTILLFSVGAAWAQGATTASGDINIGSVVASGPAGYVAPSAVAGLRAAHLQKKLAPNIISVQPQSEIRKLPDVNVAETLSRVPGISLEGDSGAGRYVQIRGLDADLNGTTYDGIKLPATNATTVSGGARATAFDVFPAGIIGGDEVVKSLTPEINAEGLGGEINLLSPSLPGNGLPEFHISGGGGYEQLRHSGVYDGSTTVGQNFSIPGLNNFVNPKPFSVILTVAAHGDNRGIDDFEPSYSSATAGGQPASLSGLQYRRYQEHRDVQGISGELDFDPDPQTNVFFRGIHTGYNEYNDKNRLQLDGLDNGGNGATQNADGSFTSTTGTALKNYTNSNERIALDLFEFGGHTIIANLVTVDAHTSYAQGSDIFTRQYGSNFNYSTTDGSAQDPLNITYNTSQPSHFTYVATDANGNPVNLASPNHYLYSNISNTPNRAFDKIYENAGDASIPTSFFHLDGEFKAGVDILLREKSFRQQEFDGTPNNLNIPLSSVVNGNGDAIYYNSQYNVGPNVNNFDVFAIPTTYVENYGAELAAFQHDQENVYAGYGQQSINFGNLSVLGGVRVEATKGTYGANAATTDANGNTTYTPNVNHQSYTNVFPSLQLKYAFTPEFQMRAAYSTAIARPGFQQITAAKVTDYQAGTVSNGNPNLKPTTGNSFDVTAEYYTQHDGLLSANLFYKDFSNYIAQSQSNQLILFPSGVFLPAIVSGYLNIGKATAQGIELDGHQKFYFLPAPFNGFGVDANLTLVNATAEIHKGLKKSILPQTSPITYNVAGFYEEGPISLRVAVDYVSRNLFAVGADPSTDTFSQPRFRLDIGGTCQITPRLQFYADGKNLTNTKLEFTQSASNAYPIQREFYSQDYLAGFRYDIN